MGNTLSRTELLNVARQRQPLNTLQEDVGNAAAVAPISARQILLACIETRVGAEGDPVLGDLETRNVAGYPAGIQGMGRDVLLAVLAQFGNRTDLTDVDTAQAIAPHLGMEYSAHPLTCFDAANALEKIYARIADGDTNVQHGAEDALGAPIDRRLLIAIANATDYALRHDLLSDPGRFVEQSGGEIPFGEYHGGPVPGHGVLVNHTGMHIPRITPHMLEHPVYIADPGTTRHPMENAAFEVYGVMPPVSSAASALHLAALAVVADVPAVHLR